jgi:hypothetical protein
MMVIDKKALWTSSPCVLKIADLIMDWKLYPRKEIDHVVAEKYAAAMRTGSVFPPIRIGLLNGKSIIVDGVHRVTARKLLNIEYMDAVVERFDSEADLFAEAVRLNAGHGKTFTDVELRENIKRLQKYKFSVKDIQTIVSVPASEIYKESAAPIVTLATPSGKKIHCNVQKVDCAGQPDVRELIQFKQALQLIRDVAQKGCIPKDDPYFKSLVTECRLALGKVRFNA